MISFSKFKASFKNQQGVAPILILVAVIGVLAFLAISSTAPFKTGLLSSLFPKEWSHAASTTFLDTFDGTPTTPIAWDSPSWDNVVFEGGNTNLQRMYAQHGPNCEPPVVDKTRPFDLHTNPLVTHLKGEGLAPSIFQCNGHIMTAITGGYGAVYMTPNAMMDISNGEAVFKVDIATLKTSHRDWIDFLFTPFMSNKQIYDAASPGGNVKDGIRFELDISGAFIMGVTQNYQNTFGSYSSGTGGFNDLPQDPTNRQTFEFHISKNSAKIVAPSVVWKDSNGVQHTGMTFNYPNFPTPLPWDSLVISMGQKNYASHKGCIAGFDTPGASGECYNTWHWDNVSVNPAIPFTILKSVNGNFIDQTTNNVIDFNAPAPKNAFFRYLGMGYQHQFSVDGGRTWITPVIQADQSGGDFITPYFTPIPEGTQRILIKATGSWNASNFTIWSQNPLSSPIPPFQLPKDDLFKLVTGTFTAQYYNNANWSGSPVLTRTENDLGRIWDWESPDSSIPEGNDYSVRWTGKFNSDGGTYRFRESFLGQGTVLLDGRKIIDTTGFDAGYEQGVTTDQMLPAGQHDLVVLMNRTGGNQGRALLEYYKFNNVVTPISTPDPGQFKAEYFDLSNVQNPGDDFNNDSLFAGKTPVFIRGEDEINSGVNYGRWSSTANIIQDIKPENKFGVRWTKTENFVGGRYEFIVNNDDGLTLWLDGQQIIKNYCCNTNTVFVNVAPGNHSIKVEYYQNSGNLRASAHWTAVDAGVVIPSPLPSVNPSSPSPSPASSIIQSPSPSSSAKAGDITGASGVPDGKIDIFDYNQLLTDFGSTNPNAKGNVDHLVNAQGVSVDIQDYGLLLTNFGN